VGQAKWDTCVLLGPIHPLIKEFFVIFSLIQLINYRIGSGGVLMFITKQVVGKMLCLPQISINKPPLIKQINGTTTT